MPIIAKPPTNIVTGQADLAGLLNTANAATGTVIDLVGLAADYFTGDVNTIVTNNRCVTTSAITNGPPLAANVDGLLFTEVLAGDRTMQTWMSLNPNITARRLRTSGSWSAWEFASEGKIPSMQTGDLNTVVTGIRRYVTPTVTNFPSGETSFAILDVTLTLTDLVFQRLTAVDNGNIYTRRLYSGTWSAWRKVTATAI